MRAPTPAARRRVGLTTALLAALAAPAATLGAQIPTITGSATERMAVAPGSPGSDDGPQPWVTG